MSTFKTLADVKLANKALGHYWFSRDAMKFFDTRIESDLIDGQYFITSEQFSKEPARTYSIRWVNADARIWVACEGQRYATKTEALDAIKSLLRG